MSTAAFWRPSFREQLNMSNYAILSVAFIVLSFGLTPTFGQSKKIIVVVGAEGAPEYGAQFNQWSEKWRDVVSASIPNEVETSSAASTKPEPESIELLTIGTDPIQAESDRDRLKHELTQLETEPVDELWLVLIGHGTFDSEQAKFNLRGRDATAKQLSEWLAPLKCRVVIINCTSASGPFINELTGHHRIVLTATKSGFQHNFARFGGYLAECIGDPTIDLDKDNQTSLLEAFLAASARTQEFYVQENRLASELALLDDNGDGLGTPADWFNGTRAVEKSQQGIADGLAANQVFLLRRSDGLDFTKEQLQARDALELQLEKLRERKPDLTEDTYYELLEPLLLELANVYQDQDSDN